ncbi:MAG: bifunctional hydroxymethylpyrimidine kinase/phosphomethylpyrimidine kinase [Planctomycetota bacterium]|jgi:hydroxymethylpyrimidine/phosphomethylpyrimidine kinase
MRTALTIAGSDPSGGAGIQGDLKTFTRHGVYGMAAITALTVQNTQGVRGVHDVPPAFVAAQLDAIFDDMPVHAAKTGMVSVVPTIEAIAEVLVRRGAPPLVVDPVMVATSGDPLVADEAVEAMVRRLFPLAALVTPNLPEAERLCGFAIESPSHMERAAQALVARGARAVLIKGGHLEGDEIVDLLYFRDTFHEFRGARIDTVHSHGTGCAMAASIAAGLALGESMPEAVERSREFVRRGLEEAVVLGKGTNPLNHFA